MTGNRSEDHGQAPGFGFLIQRLARILDARMKGELAAVGLDFKLFPNLMVLGQQDGINQREIGQKLDFPEYFTSRAIDALVEAGLAERRADPGSRRAVLVFLTAAGRAKALELQTIVARVNGEFLDGLSPAERRTTLDVLRRLTTATEP
ncbi:MAG: MarR family winged helix-turn-helix transcriptional regulator [Silicimonas sp.]|nr:MarR family winged helix-turn-helix transcriptional regulator [Silicimonas sp.]